MSKKKFFNDIILELLEVFKFDWIHRNSAEDRDRGDDYTKSYKIEEYINTDKKLTHRVQFFKNKKGKILNNFKEDKG